MGTLEAGGRTIQAHLVPSYDELGELDGAVGVATDITELVRAQTELGDTEARHSVLLDALHEERARYFGFDPTLSASRPGTRCCRDD